MPEVVIGITILSVLLTTIVLLILGIPKRPIWFFNGIAIIGLLVYALIEGDTNLHVITVSWWSVTLVLWILYATVAGPIIVFWPQRKSKSRNEPCDRD